MKTPLLLIAWLMCLGSASVHAGASVGIRLAPIFNGTNLAGWRAPQPNPFWTVKNGVLIGANDGQMRGNVIYTESHYTNFVLELEARWSGEIDSGILLRDPELQVQFGVSRSLKKDMTGAFYLARTPDNPTSGYPESGHTHGLAAVFKPDDWNRFRIEARGDAFTVWCNGQRISQYQDPRYPGGGPLGLQVHPGLKMKIEFRHLYAVELD
ncbi:MAG TPA: DUF1080 domain-containing protein [Verrucomicrobiota bacterium]|nr:DUF1080 domain-containing protein [Verrucomicrobiota bacterium]HNT13480.1 DUF1080 domain-containing protein [Verrucomicrobiota bacterium]